MAKPKFYVYPTGDEFLVLKNDGTVEGRADSAREARTIAKRLTKEHAPKPIPWEVRARREITVYLDTYGHWTVKDGNGHILARFESDEAEQDAETYAEQKRRSRLES